MKSREITDHPNDERTSIGLRLMDRLSACLMPEFNQPPETTGPSPEIKITITEAPKECEERIEINPHPMKTELGPIHVKDNGDSPDSIEGPGAIGLIPESTRRLLGVSDDDLSRRGTWYSGPMTISDPNKRSYRIVNQSEPRSPLDTADA